MAKKKQLSNRIKDIIEHDIIARAFIVSALDRMSSAVINNQEEIHRQMERSLVTPDAWIEAAEKVNKLIKE